MVEVQGVVLEVGSLCIGLPTEPAVCLWHLG